MKLHNLLSLIGLCFQLAALFADSPILLNIAVSFWALAYITKN